MANIVEQLDQYFADLLSGWNGTSTLIVLAIAGYLAYLVASAQDPDIHPMLLQRQATASLVRKPGESAIYRSTDTPHGFPLRTGLNVKAKGAPAYASGKDGDLRDIWRRVNGDVPMDKSFGAEDQAQGKILTVFGKEQVTEHAIGDMTKEIAIVGAVIKKQGGSRVAIYLPNSVEFLVALFACSFYGLSPILLPYNQPHKHVIDQLAATKADVLIAQAGSLPLEDVTKQHKALKQVVWVVEKTSRHVDWTEVPEHVGGKMDVSMWHQLIQDHQDVSDAGFPELASNDLPPITTVWIGKPGSTPEIVQFTHKNFASAIGALVHSLPVRHRLSPSDLFLSADVWTSTYALAWTLAALFSHSSVAINSVAGPAVDIHFAMRSIAPTVVVASAETASKLHAETSPVIAGGLKAMAHSAQTSALDAGRMPGNTFFTQLNAPHTAALGSSPGKLRLLLLSDRAGAESSPLSSQDLSDLRIFTGARVVYALTAAKVAGAVAQTSMFDYRRKAGAKHGHFGGPLGSVEIKVVDSDLHKTTDERAKGHIVVAGASVSGGETNLEVAGTFNDDCTLAYV